ncbi:MAG: acyltransferase family protein [Deinococcota bacterium]
MSTRAVSGPPQPIQTSQNVTSKLRIKHIDVVKGISIVLVVFGHNWLVLHDSGELYHIGLSFRMPLFFFVSGIFFRPNVPFGQLVKTKADALLKPYAVTLGILSVYQILLLQEPAFRIYAGILYAGGETIFWLPMWFLTHLFAVFLLSWAVIRYTQLDARNLGFKLVFMSALITTGYLFTAHLWPQFVNHYSTHFMWHDRPLLRTGLPFSTDILLISSFFFLSGFLLRTNVKQFQVHWGYVLLASVVFIGLHARFDYALDLFKRRYDHLLITTVLAFAGIYLTLSVAWLVSKVRLLERLLSYTGQQSLFVLIFHWYLQKKVFDVLINSIGLESQLSAVLSLVGAVLGSLIIAEIINSSPYLAMWWRPWKLVKGKLVKGRFATSASSAPSTRPRTSARARATHVNVRASQVMTELTFAQQNMQALKRTYTG